MIDKETFERIVTTATSSSAEVFESMSVYLETAEIMIQNEYIGVNLFKEFDNLHQSIQFDARRAICLDAFYNAIPFLDLVLTSTGFGIVSNSNVAPASKERVASLSAQVKRARDNALDCLLIALRDQANEKWSKEPVSKFQISSLYWTTQHLRDYAGMPDAYRSDLIKLRPRISEAEEIFRTKISSVYFDSLITAIQKNDLSADDLLIVMMLRAAIGLYLADSPKHFNAKIDRVINTFEDNADKYPIYQSSEAYKVKHFKHYENEKEDTTFFWG